MALSVPDICSAKLNLIASLLPFKISRFAPLRPKGLAVPAIRSALLNLMRASLR